MPRSRCTVCLPVHDHIRGAAACRHMKGPPRRPPPRSPCLSRTRSGMRMRFCSTPSITIESNQLRWIDTSSVRPPRRRPRSVAAPLTDSSLSKVIEGAANIDFAAYILCIQFDFDSSVSSIYHQPWNGIFSEIKISMRTHAHVAARRLLAVKWPFHPAEVI